jgi:hypothetical protein
MTLHQAMEYLDDLIPAGAWDKFSHEAWIMVKAALSSQESRCGEKGIMPPCPACGKPTGENIEYVCINTECQMNRNKPHPPRKGRVR